MRKKLCALLLATTVPFVYFPIETTPRLNHRALGGAFLSPQNAPPDVLPQATAAQAIPEGTPNYLDPNVFAMKEQEHDKLLDDLATRVHDLESTSSWVNGVIVGLVALGGFIIGLFNKLWKWILTGALNELNPQILQPSPVSPLPVASVAPPSTP